MKKLFITLLTIFAFIMPLNAVSSDSVNYKVKDYIVDASVDISGNVKVKEIIRLDGTFNGYIRDLIYKNDNAAEFTGIDSDFEGSSIYNASGVYDVQVGEINWNGDLTFDAFNEEVTYFELSEGCAKGSKRCYTNENVNNGVTLTMYNETKNASTYFYIEYLLGNLAVIHDDVAEIYYNFIGNGFDDVIKNYQLRLILPDYTKDQVRVWAHGPVNGEVYLLSDGEGENISYVGGYLKISDLDSNTPVDMRMAFPKDLIIVDFEGITKHSNMNALDKILAVEQARADSANKLREMAKIRLTGTYIITGLYLLITAALIVYVYLKYDKEYKSDFNSEYNREFIDDYDVTVIEYLFDKKISEKAFTTSILNLVYKKNIKVEEIVDGKKKDYKFIKLNDDNTSIPEKNLMTIIFNEAGNGTEVTLKDIKKYASKITGTTSPFLNSYNEWQYLVKDDAIKEDFYENNTAKKVPFFLYCLLGVVIFFIHMYMGMFNILTILTVVFTIAFVIYLAVFTKRSAKGNNHYARWKAFKRFLEDFGRFDEKELPEIALWERYLVYASIFGIADKVSKTMKMKFDTMNAGGTYTRGDFFYDYFMWNSINNSLSRTVNNSITTAHSKLSQAQMADSSYSSGGGFGGGFSSGGGFGGGGGGGRGF